MGRHVIYYLYQCFFFLFLVVFPLKTFSESQNPSFLALNMGHYLQCLGTFWDIFHSNKNIVSLGQFSGQYFSFRDTFLPILSKKPMFFASGEAFSCLNFGRFLPGVCFLPTPTAVDRDPRSRTYYYDVLCMQYKQEAMHSSFSTGRLCL